MLKAIALFELRTQLKRPLLWLMLGVFFLMAFTATVSDSVRIGGGIGNVHRNAPLVIMRFHLILSIFGLLLSTMFVAGAILRDFDLGTYEMFFSRPVRRRDYVLGRFLAALATSVIVFLGVPIGMIAGSFAPWLDPARLGPFMPEAYAYALLALALPNLFLSAATFFTVASLSRSMLYTYLAVVGFFVAYVASLTLIRNLETLPIGALLDPFGIAAIVQATRYWTVVESNSALPPLSGVLLANRLIWLGVAVAMLAVALLRFRLMEPARRRRPGALAVEATNGLPAATVPPGGRVPAAVRSFTAWAAVRQALHQARLEVMGVVKGVAFLVMLAFGMFNLVTSIILVDAIFGTPVWPVTHLMIDSIQGSFIFLLIIIVTFYSGELIWRERSLKLAEVTDAMPVPNWVYLAGKLAAQVVVVLAFTAVGIVTAMACQLVTGYSNLEPLVYLKGFVEMVVPFLLVCFVASFVQVATGNKFVGYLVMILLLIYTDVLDSLGLDHNLYRFPNTRNAPYSDMNGYGHFTAPVFWFNVYWAFFAAGLTGLAAMFWMRGTDTSLRTRLRLAGQRLTGPMRVVLAVAALGFVATGAFIYYNTNVLNEYVGSEADRDQRAEYEKSYRRYKDVALPRVRAVYADVDIFPAERRVEIRGRYRVANAGSEPLAEIHMTIPRRVKVNRLDLPAHTEKLHDTRYGYRIYTLNKPLQPGEEATIGFDLTVRNRGFENRSTDDSIVRNGTFFNSRRYFPSFGYSDGAELQDPNERRKRGLPPLHRMARVDDVVARGNTYIANDADWIDFSTVVSTSADQIAIAPGYLQREWTVGDRRYFHYRMDSPILHFYSYLSARYQVRRDAWNGVAIEIYYHEPHTYNLDRMVQAVKKSLDYFTANFGPYQHRQVRIVEFPRYAQFAQSFPNTIPFSESAGFIARLKGSEDEAIDYPFYLTAHEVAHQWWAHQLIGGNVQGCTLMSESLAQYSALMVMEKEYGPEKMRRFLRYELDRYLRKRGTELVEEMPLQLVENQDYIHYNKGSIVTYALRDYVGESVFNRVLARYLAARKFQQPPYTNSLEFMAELARDVPTERQALLDDMFRTITLFENRAADSTFSRRADGTYAVTVNATAKKLRADGQGVETEVPLDDWIDIGVFADATVAGRTEEKPLYLQKHHVTGHDITVEVVVAEKPERAGIDPYNKLVDRNSADNVRKVKEASSNAAPTDPR
jgi:ABC-type transport system involved in multi-copper enzyme maturation permease subunit